MTHGGTPRELHDAFLDLEVSAGLWDERAYGQDYWHNVRWDIWGHVQQALGMGGPKQRTWRSRPWQTWLKPRATHVLDNLRRSSWHDLAPADLLVFNHPRHVLDGGAWHCPYSGPVLEQLPHSRWVIEQGFQGVHYSPNHTRGLKYIEWAKWAEYARFAARDGWRGARLNEGDVLRVRRWAQMIRTRLGGGPNDDQALALVRTAIRRKIALGQLFERLLDTVQPRVMIHVVHYSFRGLVMTPLAKARSIPVVELQHGFIGPTHLAYNVAPGVKPVAFPDYLLLFGKLWREITPGLPLPEERTPAIGFARLEQLRRLAGGRPTDGPRTLLFISQPAIGEALSRAAVETAELLGNGRIRVVVRLHPGEMQDWRTRYPWLVNGRVTVVDSPSDDLYASFAQADLQVGVYSTALFEGLAFGLPTAILRLPGYEGMDVLVQRGLARLVTDAAALVEMLEANLPSPDPSQLGQIWQPNAESNFKTFLHDLLND
jgi:hypothetical protein